MATTRIFCCNKSYFSQIREAILEFLKGLLLLWLPTDLFSKNIIRKVWKDNSMGQHANGIKATHTHIHIHIDIHI